jgi:hypothetical protein
VILKNNPNLPQPDNAYFLYKYDEVDQALAPVGPQVNFKSTIWEVNNSGSIPVVIVRPKGEKP